jgi:hypothetical protein
MNIVVELKERNRNQEITPIYFDNAVSNLLHIDRID